MDVGSDGVEACGELVAVARHSLADGSPRQVLGSWSGREIDVGGRWSRAHRARATDSLGLKSSMFGMASIISRSEEHTSELQSLMRISYAVFCLKKKNEQT